MDKLELPRTAISSSSEISVDDLRAAILAKLRYAVGKNPEYARAHDWFVAVALALRDRVIDRWISSTQRTYAENRKRVYYLSLEFLVGRMLVDTATNMGLLDTCREALRSLNVDFDNIRQLEPDAALGNGGLGRLAACYMESMSTVGLAGFGYGIRYEFGLFRQAIRDGRQIELPEDWLDNGNPWEFERPEVAYEIGFGGWVASEYQPDGRIRSRWHPAERVVAVAFDTPIVGWQGRTVNTLRLWSARTTMPIRLDVFNRGAHKDAFEDHLHASIISRVLYPDDSTPAGEELRLRQELFFTSASLQDLLRRHLVNEGTPATLPDHAAIQLNDTHPALAVVELVRLLVDEQSCTIEEAFTIAQATFGYTNHTLLPEALESWPVGLFERLLPRHMQLIYAINSLHLAKVRSRPDVSEELIRAVSLIDEHNGRRVRMGHLAFVGSRRVNGVSALHGALMRETVFKDLHLVFPDRIRHVTNGVTFRRWLVQCNPGLASLITEALGSGWIDDAGELIGLNRYVEDTGFLGRMADVKHAAKVKLAALVARELGVNVDPRAMFDVHIKRIHEYKRQLLNILETVAHYEAVRADPKRGWTPRVKIFAGKAAASYHRAKLVIKLINDVARVINRDPAVRDVLRVVFLPNYNVSLAELIVPAADLSEQISTAGMEASGTGNMKLALNGAVTIGTLDGANVEISDRVGNDNILIFGLTAEQVNRRRREGHAPSAIIEDNQVLQHCLSMIRSGLFSPEETGRFEPIVDDLHHVDHFMLTPDFESYALAQRKADELFADAARWRRMSLWNTAHMGWFSSDRSILEYARTIWEAPTDHDSRPES